MAETAYYSSTAWNPGRDEKPRRRGQLDARSRRFRVLREKEDEMHSRVKRIDTERRPNLMAEKLKYAS